MDNMVFNIKRHRDECSIVLRNVPAENNYIETETLYGNFNLVTLIILSIRK